MALQNPTSGNLLRIGGAFTAVFSLAMGLLVLFVIPGACSFVGSLQILILGSLFVIGGLAFLFGRALLGRQRRYKPPL